MAKFFTDDPYSWQPSDKPYKGERKDKGITKQVCRCRNANKAQRKIYCAKKQLGLRPVPSDDTCYVCRKKDSKAVRIGSVVLCREHGWDFLQKASTQYPREYAQLMSSGKGAAIY